MMFSRPFKQVQGLVEHFQDTCGGIIGWLSAVTSYTAFIEGWALYAENPLIAYDTDTYKGEPLYKYGMLKSQVGKRMFFRKHFHLASKNNFFGRHRKEDKEI